MAKNISILTNGHTINISFKGGSKLEVKLGIKKFISNASKYVKTLENESPIKPNFFLNYMMKKNSNGELVPSYRGFVYFEDSRIYYLALGLDLDGSKLIDFIPDPEWKPPINKKMKWGDYMEDQLFIKVEKESPIPPMVYYDDENIKCNFLIRPARIQDELEDDVNADVLFTIVPTSISDEQFKNIFKLFSVDPKYPQIASSIMENRTQKKIFVMFKQGTTDAQFALQLTRILKVKGRNKQKFFLHFSHALFRKNL